MNNYIKIYSSNLDCLKYDVISEICRGIKNRNKRKMFMRLEEVEYISNDNGPMEDQLAYVNVNGREAIFVAEGAEYPDDYDFEEDPDGITVAFMHLEDMTVPSLLRVLSKVCMNDYRYYLERFNRLCYRVFNVFKGIDPIYKYTINEEIRMYGDRSWQDFVVTEVTRCCYYLKDDKTPYSFDEMPFDQLCIIADATETMLMHEWENPLPGAN